MEEPFLERVAQNRNFCAIKESSGDINRIHLLAREYPQLQLSAGAEDQVLEFFAWGARSWVSVVANFFPRPAVRFYETCVIGDDFTLGRRIMSAFLPLMYCLERGGKFLQSVKYACEIMNRPGGPVRPPMLPMEKELKREVFQIVNTANRTLTNLLDTEA
jgi:4-hydroxy-tetrahydrodipicolinate synthase